MKTRAVAPADRAKPVGIWIRVSTEDQARGESPEHHEKRARGYAEAKGWNVREVYRLEAVSGKSVMGHPETQRMLEHAASGHITGLIFSKLARLARNTRELLDFADIFREHDADLISLHESIDTTTPAGRLFYTMIAAMAQWEREEIAERVAASVPIRAKLGKPTGGAAPFGYQWVDRQLLPHPDEAPIRRLIYELFLEHKRKKAVARLLNEKGYRTRGGAEFTDTTIDRLIRDPAAKGTRRANYTRSTGDKKHWVLKPRSDWVLSRVEPVVTEELWEQCNAILTDGRERMRRNGRPPVHLFSGLVRCHCGRTMYVFSSSPKYVCKDCRNKIGTADLEAVFQEQLRGFFLNPEEVAKHLAQSDEVLRSKEEQLQGLHREETKVRTEMDRVYRAYVSDEISVEGFGRQYRPLEARLKQLEEETPRLQGEVDFMKIQLVSRDEVLSGARDLYDRWSKLAPDEKRQIVEAIVERIEVAKDEVTLDLAYVPGSSEIAGKSHRNFTPALPFSRLRLRSPRVPETPRGYPVEPKTLGEHVRRLRLDLGLTHREAARALGIHPKYVAPLERGLHTPTARALAAIVRFLGYDPVSVGDSPPQRLRAARRGLGLTQVQLARRLGLNRSTIQDAENGRGRRQGRVRRAIGRFLKVADMSQGESPGGRGQ